MKMHEMAGEPYSQSPERIRTRHELRDALGEGVFSELGEPTEDLDINEPPPWEKPPF